MREVNYTINIIMHRNWILISLLLIGVLLSNSRMLTAQQESVTVIVATQSTNVRANSSTATAIVGTLQTGESAPLIGETTTGEAVNGITLWYQIQLSGNRQGWVWSGAVTQVQVTPTPIPTARPTLVPNENYEVISTENVRQVRLVYQWGRGYPSQLAWSPNGEQLLVASSRGLWRYQADDLTSEPEQVYDFAPPSQNHTGMARLGYVGNTTNIWYVGYTRNQNSQPVIQIINLESGNRGATIPLNEDFGGSIGHSFRTSRPNQRVALSPDGHTFAIAEDDQIRFVRLRYSADRETIINWDELESLTIPFRVDYIAFSPDGTKLVISGDTGFSTGHRSQIYTFPDLTLLSNLSEGGPVLFSDDGSKLMIGFVNYLVIDVQSGVQERELAIQANFPWHEALSFDGRILAVSDRSNPPSVYFYDTEQGGVLEGCIYDCLPAIDHTMALDYSTLAYQPNGSLLAGFSRDSGILSVWNTDSNEELLRDEHYMAANYWESDLQFDETGNTVAIRQSRRVSLYDLNDPTGLPVYTLLLSDWNSIDVTLVAPQMNRIFVMGSVLIAPNWETRIQVLDLDGTSLIEEQRFENVVSSGFTFSPYTAYAFNNQGSEIAIGDYRGAIEFHDSTSFEMLRTLPATGTAVEVLQFSHDGHYIVSAGNRTLRLWTANGELLQILPLPDTESPLNERGIDDICMNEDGRYLSAVADRYRAFVWDMQSQILLWTFTFSPDDRPESCSLSPNGELLAIGTTDGYIHIYNLNNGRSIRSPLHSSFETTNIRFSPNGSLLMSSGQDGVIRFWGIPFEQSSPTVTATPSATMTIVPTPSPTATPTVASSNARFYDDFTQGDLTQWDVTYAADQVEIAEMDDNPVLHLLGNQTDYVSLGFHDSLTDAAILQARVQVIDFGPRDGSFNFNLMSELPGHGTGYSALIGRGGSFLAERNDGFRGLDSFDSRTFTLQTGRWYTIRFEQRGSTLILTVDDEVIHQAHVSNDLSGQPLFIFDAGMELYLDDVWVE